MICETIHRAYGTRKPTTECLIPCLMKMTVIANTRNMKQAAAAGPKPFSNTSA